MTSLPLIFTKLSRFYDNPSNFSIQFVVLSLGEYVSHSLIILKITLKPVLQYLDKSTIF